ncbi:MAG: MG2 domain-containing protein [Parasulfuritortus sp.]|nr:MG2 domain-containing protein [Parasulfuritortus sp.]
MFRFAIPGLLASVLFSSLGLAAGVESFSPQGEVKGVRQVSARFDVDMVPLGDPRLADPFTVDCPAKGKGRWVDNRNWVYDFDKDLPAGVACRFTLTNGSKDLAGEKLTPARFDFTTGGPAILTSVPAEGETISEEQVFVLGLDAPVKESTLAGRVWCAAEGIAEKVPARLVTGEDKRKLLAASDSFFQDYLSVLANGHGLYMLDVHSGNTREELLRSAGKPGAPVIVLRCGRRLPADHDVSLVWGKGIESASGIATSSEQTLAFKTRPDFSARFHCEKLNPRQPCLPVLPMQLNFTSPVSLKSAEGVTLASGNKSWHGKFDDEEKKSGYVQSLTFDGPFPESANLVLSLPAKIRDQDGRALVNARSFPLRLKTDIAPPLAKFASDFGIYELNAQPALPLTMRYVGALSQSHALLNAERLVTQKPSEVIEWMRRIREMSANQYGEYDKKKGYTPIAHFGGETSIFEARHKIQPLQLPKPLPDRETEVVGIPLSGAGFHIVEVASPRLGAALMDKPKPYYVRATALVTNMAVHLKRGDESSLVWVTRLDNAEPVAGAEVAVRDCANTVYAKGRTDAAGILRIDHELPGNDRLPDCLEKYDKQLFVTAAKDGDFSFLLSDWGEGISPWRFNLYQSSWQGPYVAHAVLDRSLFRPGEEVAMKLFVRRKKSVGFGYVDVARLDKEIILRHQGSDEEIKLQVKWDGQGIALAKYTLPKEAKQGTYEILIPNTLRGHDENQLSAGEFRVATFRVPTVKARLSGPTQAINVSEVKLDMQAEYLAGGAAAQLPITLRGQLQPYDVSYPDYEEASFANGRVQVGKQDERAEWAIGNYDTDEELPVQSTVKGVTPLKILKFKLDAGGSGRDGWQGLPASDLPRVLQAEAEYRDANGETRNAATSVVLYPSNLMIGVKPDSWVQAKAQQRFRIIALNTAGKPQAGVAVSGRLYQSSWYSYRKRVIGGFYAYQHGSEIKPLPDTCSGRTDERGLFFCELHSKATGSLIFEAQAKDDKNNPSYAQRDFWVPEGDGWVDSSDNDRMDLIPESKHYEVGDKARFHLRMPFESARVLVSVEREGVLDAWVTEVKRDNPVIEVPIKPEYGPNVFVSALAVRGRIGDVQPTAMVDLGRPAFRMGMAEIQTGWSGYALKVAVETDKKTYHTRDKVKVKVKVRRPDGSLPGEGAEIALAAVDEGLLELAPNDSWKLLDAMMQRRGIAVTTSTAQMQVVGKRHFGRKAVAAGGGGGAGTQARELFDTRIFWQGRVKLDAQGEAEVEVPLNDSLTRFRIVAVANVNVGRFGTGETDVAVTQDLQILSGAAPLVREGDRLKVYFTLRNTSDHAMDVDVAPRLNGQAQPVRSEHLAAGEGREIGLPVDVPFNVSRLDWDVEAKEHGGMAHDRLKVSEQVKEAVPVRTFQATLLQLGKAIDVPIQRPADAVPGRGGIGLKFQASLAGDLAGVQEYMNYYPWTCLEQQTSKAIARDDESAWDSIAASLPAYLDGDGLAKYWPDMREGSDTLTAYLLSVSAEAGYEIPEASRTRMIQGLQGFIEGHVLRDSALRTADLAVRKLAAIEALSRYSEVQVQPAWLQSFNLTPNLWPTSAVIDWIDILDRVQSLPERDTRLKEARTILRSRLNFSGTVMGFSTERNDNWWWLMVNGDSNANRMILEALDGNTGWSAEDVGRLMRGSLARQQKGHWNTTVANAWGVLATKRFSEKLETVPVTGITKASLAGHTTEQDWAKAKEGSGLLPWPKGQDNLGLSHNGQGKPWVTLSSLAAIPLKAPLNSGYRITREVQPIEQRERGVWHRGDVMRVRLTVDAQTDMGWVALLDPIPSGATILGTGLGGDSALLTQGETRQGWVWPAYEERTHDSFRSYYDFVPKGQFTVEYTVRLNNEGHFNLPSARVEAMYAPELFGEVPVADVDVKP